MDNDLTIDLTNFSSKELITKIKEKEIQKIENFPSIIPLVNEFLLK